MTEKTKCPSCGREMNKGTEPAAAVTLYGECVACCIAHQKQMDPLRLQAQALAELPVAKRKDSEERLFMLRVTTRKDIRELAGHIENRIWSLDGVTDVIAIEQ